jgi:hypothetical protein
MRTRLLYTTLCAMVMLGGIVLVQNFSEASSPITPKAPSNQGFALVELFTSQGCSSCPPADVVLKELTRTAEAQNQAIFTLSFHVDYWNSLGWKDPYSSKQFTDRQRRYGEVLRTESIYTPQMIVNGQTEFVGSNAGDARQVITKALEAVPELTLKAIARVTDNGTVRVEYTTSALPSSCVVNIALVRDVEPISVSKGENTGRKLAHTHVVRVFESFPLANQRGTHDVHVPNDAPARTYRIIAYVQDTRTLRILAAQLSILE